MDHSTDAVPSFSIIPAIDLLDGRIVRLFQGNYDRSTVYERSPAEQVRAFYAAGARLLHLVDLNAARTGDRSRNHSAVQEVLEAAARVGLRVQIGGGIRGPGAVQEILSQGADRVVIGTAAVKNPDLVGLALREFGPDRIVVGVDALAGKVRVSGWEEQSGLDAYEFLNGLESLGVQMVIYTDIARDGALTGPPLEDLKRIGEQCKLKVIASGGVSSLEDVRSLIALRGPVGLITGKAIYEGALDLEQAIRLAEGNID